MRRRRSFPACLDGLAQRATGSDDEAALDTLASILSSGRGSRLQSNLNYWKELVSQIFANNSTNEIGGLFQITATARPGKTLNEIEKEITHEIDRIKEKLPTAEEIERSLNGRNQDSYMRCSPFQAKVPN